MTAKDSHTSRLAAELDRGCLRRPHEGCKSNEVVTPAEEARKSSLTLSVRGLTHVQFDGLSNRNAFRAWSTKL